MLHRLLVILLLTLGPLEVQAQALSIVSFTFDDAPNSVVEIGLPILDKYDIDATVYISTRNTQRKGFMDWNKIALVANSGWEIGAHTHTHAHLTKVSDQLILGEIQTSMGIFAKHGYKPVHFASPHGDYDDRVIEILKRHYKSHRAAWPIGMNTIHPDPYQIASYYLARNTTLEELKKLLNDLQIRGGWVVFQIHGVLPKGSDVVGDYDTNLLEDLVEEVHTRGLTTLTVGQALEKLKPNEGE